MKHIYITYTSNITSVTNIEIIPSSFTFGTSSILYPLQILIKYCKFSKVQQISFINRYLKILKVLGLKARILLTNFEQVEKRLVFFGRTARGRNSFSYSEERSILSSSGVFKSKEDKASL